MHVRYNLHFAWICPEANDDDLFNDNRRIWHTFAKVPESTQMLKLLNFPNFSISDDS